jgi:hypothetical protein
MTDVRSPRSGSGSSHSAIAPVRAGQDRFGERRGLGVSTIEFKVTGNGNDGLFVLENTFHAKSGPARHLHVAEDEWLYAVERA